MKTEEYNKLALTDFLLGKSSEHDADLYDELSITDDNFAIALKSAEDELIDSYIRGELIDTDARRFEASYLASPMRREKVEFAKALQIVAEKNRMVISQVSEKKTWAEFFAFLNFNSALRYVFAALLLAFIGFGSWVLYRNSNNDEIVKVTPTPQPTIQPTNMPNTNQPTPTPQVSPTVIKPEKTPEPKLSPTPQPTAEPTNPPTPNLPTLATFVLLPPTRGGNSLQTISIPKQVTDVAFGLPLETDDFKSYRVFLKNQAGKILWQSGKLTSKKSALNVRFPAKLLQPSIYSLAVVGIGEENEPENIGNYSFRSVIK
jgi:hypothetical protein